jgi:hypothetical protein
MLPAAVVEFVGKSACLWVLCGLLWRKIRSAWSAWSAVLNFLIPDDKVYDRPSLTSSYGPASKVEDKVSASLTCGRLPRSRLLFLALFVAFQGSVENFPGDKE